jgi:tetratricopeptide (TPR) repeat protein
MHMIRGTFLTVVAAVATLTSTSVQAKWVEAKSQHFDIYGDVSQSEATGYAIQLERFDHLLRGIANLPATSESENDRVTVYLVSLDMVQSLAKSLNVAGFYNSDIQETLAVMPLSLPDYFEVGPFHVMFHEWTHHIFLSSADATYPSWVEEGLAEFFGTTTFRDDGSIVIGAPPQMRGWALHRQVQMSLADLLDSDGKKLDEQDMEDKYALGWLVTHYLLLGHQRPKQYDAYLKLVASGVPSLEAGRQAFGDLRKLDGELERYNVTGRFPSYALPATFSLQPPQVRVLNACEAKFMPTRIRSAVGVDEKTAPALVGPARAAAADCSGDSFVQRALAEVEFDAKNNKESMAAADRALAADPSNLMAMVYKGRVFARQSQWADARTWFIKANHLKPNYALPLVLYYDTFMRAGVKPPETAVNGLMRAIVLAPESSDLRLRVAYELIEEGDLPLARKILAPVAFAPHEKADDKEKNKKDDKGNDKADNKALEVLRKIDAKAPANEVLALATAAKWNEIGKE